MHGPHLMLDCYGCRSTRLGDKKFVLNLLEKIRRAVSVCRIAPPLVVVYKKCPKRDWGISAVILIAESHISMHTYPERRSCAIDVYSCIKFDRQPVIELVRKSVLPKRMETEFLYRGKLCRK